MSVTVLRHKIIFLATAAAVLTTAAIAAPAATSIKQDAQRLLDGIPLYFEANRGQTDSAVKFLTRAPGRTVFLTGTETVMRVGEGALRMSLRGGNPVPVVEGLQPRKSFTSYFIGNQPENWQRRVEQFGGVRYRSVYPGIDLYYYGKGRRLEHDFVVSPGADPGAIRMAFEGADRIGIESDGSLSFEVAGERVAFGAPYAYVRGEEGPAEVAARFVQVGPTEVEFEVGDYDRSRTLVIDPVLIYSTYFGGSNLEAATQVEVDPTGHILVAGLMTSDDYPTNGGGIQGGEGGSINGFFLRLNPNAGPGEGMAYSNIFGGLRNESVTGMEVDSAGNVYITGMTLSGDFPVTDNAVQTARPSIDENAYLIKFNLNTEPKLLYGTYLGGEGRDEGYGLAVDDQQRAYLTGFSLAVDFPLSGDPLQGAERGGGDAFFSVIDTVGGGLLYSTYLGGTSSDWGTDITVIGDGSVYLTGFTASDDYPNNGNAYQGFQRGGGDAFLTRIDWSKSGLPGLGYSTYLGGEALDVAYGVVQGPSGVYNLIGYTLSMDFPTTAAAIQSTNAGNADVFVATLDPSKPGGEGLLFSTYYGGAGGDVPYEMALDAAGGLALAGYSMSEDLPISGDYFENSYHGLTDAFFVRLDPNKPAGEVLTCSSFLGGSQSDVAWAMTVDNIDNMYFVGQTSSPDFPVTPDALIAEKPGQLSAFVTKFAPCASPGGTADGTSDRPRSSRTGVGRAGRGGGRGR